MKILKVLAWLGLISMTAVIGNGFINGNFSKDGAELLSNPWGLVSMVDLYLGFALFSCWIAFREKNIKTTIVWIFLMMVLGFFTASLYILVALSQSQKDWLTFFLGKRKSDLLNKNRSR